MRAALDDDAHVAEQHARYAAPPGRLQGGARGRGLPVDHSEASLYLWATRGEPCWDTVGWLAERGILVAPGDFYGPAGARARAGRVHRDRRAGGGRRTTAGRRLTDGRRGALRPRASASGWLPAIERALGAAANIRTAETLPIRITRVLGGRRSAAPRRARRRPRPWPSSHWPSTRICDGHVVVAARGSAPCRSCRAPSRCTCRSPRAVGAPPRSRVGWRPVHLQRRVQRWPERCPRHHRPAVPVRSGRTAGTWPSRAR